jgi:hypothetical protein
MAAWRLLRCAEAEAERTMRTGDAAAATGAIVVAACDANDDGVVSDACGGWCDGSCASLARAAVAADNVASDVLASLRPR